MSRQIGSGAGNDYFKCLIDPFNCPPLRAGFGCMVPTQLHTAYLRGSFLVSSDGSYSLFLLPNPNNFLYITNALYSSNPLGATTTPLNAANVGVLNAMYDQTRTIAMGLRLYPMIAATSVPGVISLGCSPRSDATDLVAQSVTTATASGLFNRATSYVSQMPYLREHIARPSSLDYFQITWRPTDIKDFEFSIGDTPLFASNPGAVTTSPIYCLESNQNSGFVPRSTDSQGSFLVSCGQGLPPGASIYFEAVLHLESIDSTSSIATTDATNTSPSASVASEGVYPTMESYYRSLLSILPTVDTVAGTATSLLASPIVRQTALRYASQTLGIRSSGYSLV